MKSPRISRNRGAALAVLGLAASAGAQAAPVEPASAPRSSQTPTVGKEIPASVKSVTLGLNKAIVINLPSDVRDVIVSDPLVADAVMRTARRAYVIGRQIGSANLFFFGADGKQIANIELRVEPDVAALQDMITRLTPKARVRPEFLNGSIILSGAVPDEATAQRIIDMAGALVGGRGYSGSGAAAATGGGGETSKIINLMTIENAEQVLVKVRVVEMSRTMVKQLGVNMADVGPDSTGLRRFNPNNLAPEIGRNLNYDTYNYFSVNNDLLGGVVTSFGQIADEVDVQIAAFERMGVLRVLAEPNLTAVSGEAAKFLAGGEFPIPVGYEDGKITIEFKPFGVGLTFTPQVLSGGRISLKLATEVSELTTDSALTAGAGNATFIIPALQVRRAQTTVEMPSGGAIVMAGLIQERTRQAIEGLPGAKDVPILGALFRSRDFLNNETELVIIVTPYLVKPTDPDNIRTPLDGYANASDLESYFMGRLNKVYQTPASDLEGRKLSGPLGYALPSSERRRKEKAPKKNPQPRSGEE